MERRIFIIGAGPTGLGAGYRLQEMGYRNWVIFEKNPIVGGLSASFIDSQGFTWDIGGHVLFSHYEQFDQILEKLIGNNFIEHERESWIWLLGRFVPYPFQNNIRYLPFGPMMECLVGLAFAASAPRGSDFESWILATFGEGVGNYFMLPHNRKVWASDLRQLSSSWIADRISVPSFWRIFFNILLRRDDISWGPNNRFKFPKKGGTKAIFDAFVPYIGEHLKLNKKVVSVDISSKRITFDDGVEENYEVLINTSPLDEFICNAKGVPDKITDAARRLRYTSGVIVGVGIKRPCPSKKCWIYFPWDHLPFYRVTYFSNYSPQNVPGWDYYSLMCETSVFQGEPRNACHIEAETIRGLKTSGLLNEVDERHIISTYRIDVERSYPVPAINRDGELAIIQRFLMENGIYSRGRFGAWKYEIGNMDHSVMQGIETVDFILQGRKERIWSL